MVLVDFHCHLTESGGYRALRQPETLFQSDDAVQLVAVTNGPADWKAMTSRSSSPAVTWAIGLHPALVHGEAEIGVFLDGMRVAEAVGEIGLDYSANAKTPADQQRHLLDRLLETKWARDRLMSLHSVSATGEVVAALRRNPIPGGVLHWFLGSDDDIEGAIDLDAFFSVNTAMLRGQRGRHAVQSMPPNRVLLETDAPYGGSRQRPCRPGVLTPVIEALSKIWERDVATVRSLVESNQRSLLRRLTIVPARLQILAT